VALDAAGALAAVDRILNRGGDAENVLRNVLDALHARGVRFGAIRFAGGGGLVVGDEADAVAAPVVYEGAPVALLELAVDDRTFVERVALLISADVARRAASRSG
jgi:hypothetical protein